MPLTLGSNISSLTVQRALSRLQSGVSGALERLSSGQRVNKAPDDAAGLSVAVTLNAARRVHTQGMRNINDGISALQIADGALDQLSLVVTRIRELAEQAANGSFSAPQRKAIDMEAQELRDEYFRVSRAASFNGTRLFDGTLSQGLRLQAGFGIDGSIQSSLGGSMGNGGFERATTLEPGFGPTSVALGDLNGDGMLDIVTGHYLDDVVSVVLGKGDGNFSGATHFSVGARPVCVQLGDMNGDGALDIVTADNASLALSILLGKGDGSFDAAPSLSLARVPTSVAVGDLNGDGKLDIASTAYNGAFVKVFLGNGDGSFVSADQVATSDSHKSVTLGDFNGDGVLDMVAAAYYDSSLSVFLGNGDGSFGAETSIAAASVRSPVAVGDLNGDGRLDIVSGGYESAGSRVYLGNGDGSFGSASDYTTGPSLAIKLGDLNGDGALDMVAGDEESVRVFIGNGDGSFGGACTYAAIVDALALGDLDGDGIFDLVAEGYDYSSGLDSAQVFFGSKREGVAPLLPFSLKTQADALQALGPLDSKLAQLAAQRGVIGAFQSRLAAALNTVQSSTETYAAAEVRIRDADVAVEAAELTRLRIAQQAATAALAQANQQPKLAVGLLTE